MNRFAFIPAILLAFGAIEAAWGDEIFVYPRDHQDHNECGTWGWDDGGGFLWHPSGNCGTAGGPAMGWRGGGDTAWYAQTFGGQMQGKHNGAVALFEYIYGDDGTLYLIVRDVVIPATDPPVLPPDFGTGCPTCCVGEGE